MYWGGLLYRYDAIAIFFLIGLSQLVQSCVHQTAYLDQQVKHEDCWRVEDSIQVPLPGIEAQQLVLGRTFCQLPNGYAVVSPTRSLLMTFDLNWTLTDKVFVADDTLLSPDDTLIRLLPPQRYHNPDHIYPLPSATGKQVELGLLAGARLAIVEPETKRLRMYGFSTEWPGKEYAIQMRSDASLAYFKHAHAVWLAITPSDFFNQGDLPAHFLEDSLVFRYTLPQARTPGFVRLTPQALALSFTSSYRNATRVLPQQSAANFWGPSGQGHTCMTLQADSLVYVYDAFGKPSLVFGVNGAGIHEQDWRSHQFDRGKTKRTRADQYALSRYMSPEYGYAAYFPKGKTAFRVYRIAVDTATAQQTLEAGWDFRPEFIQHYDLKRNSVKTSRVPARERVLCMDQGMLLTVTREGWIKRYQPGKSR